MTETETTEHRVGVYGWSTGTGGVHYHRIAEPLRVLASHGITAFTGTELGDAQLCQVDTVLTDKLHDEQATKAWHELADRDSHRLVLDVDDVMWQPDHGPFQRHYTPDVLARLWSNVERAHVVTTPTAVIAEHLARHNRNVHVVPNTVPSWLTSWQMPHRERPTIGYQGSPSHLRDWTGPVRRQFLQFLLEHQDWGIHFYGLEPGEWATVTHALHTRWQPPGPTYYASLSMDVGVGPLRDTPFNRGKSALRAIEYAALGIVAVLPDLEPYRGWVEDGVTGRLIGRGQTLRGVLREVAADPGARILMARTARERAAFWTTEAQINRWVDAWASR